MTRETKVGIVVASAFVLLIAGVLAYKIYVLGEGMPAVADAAVSQPVPEATSPAPPSTVQATRQAQPPQPEPPTQQNTAQIPEVGASLEIVGPLSTCTLTLPETLERPRASVARALTVWGRLALVPVLLQVT